MEDCLKAWNLDKPKEFLCRFCGVNEPDPSANMTGFREQTETRRISRKRTETTTNYIKDVPVLRCIECKQYHEQFEKLPKPPFSIGCLPIIILSVIIWLLNSNIEGGLDRLLLPGGIAFGLYMLMVFMNPQIDHSNGSQLEKITPYLQAIYITILTGAIFILGLPLLNVSNTITYVIAGAICIFTFVGIYQLFAKSLKKIGAIREESLNSRGLIPKPKSL